MQSEIQWSMRAILMDWLIQVHARFGLLPETMFLTANYIDRFLSCKVVSLQKLQLVGATALFLAAKYEEVNCPSVHEIVYMVDGGYTAEEILKAERFMLSMLQFELGWPGPMSFLRRVSKADDYDLETRTLAKYFLEITIMDERFVGSPPSFLAAGAHCLARHMLGKGSWVCASNPYPHYPSLTFHTDSCARLLCRLYRQAARAFGPYLGGMLREPQGASQRHLREVRRPQVQARFSLRGAVDGGNKRARKRTINASLLSTTAYYQRLGEKYSAGNTVYACTKSDTQFLLLSLLSVPRKEFHAAFSFIILPYFYH
jgi:hypothetical protein